MKTLITIMVALSSNFVWAHADHAKPKPIAQCLAACTKVEIAAAIPAALDALIAAGRVTSEWKTAKVEETKLFKDGSEWVTTLFNAKQKDVLKQRLHIFITSYGLFNGANYDGK